jgi:dienelactone hydrolase
VKIVDFGLARLLGAVVTQTGLMAGTLAYMAPEQFRGVSDARADLWALGAVMYEMLTGRQPFARDDAVATMEAVLNREPAPVRSLRPEVPPALAAVVERALQKAPANRFTTAREMLKALDVIGLVGAAGEGIRPVRHTIRRRVAALLVIAIVAGLGYVLAVTLVDRSRARWAREVALPEIRRLIEQDDYDAAYPLAQQAFRYIPSDPVLAELWPQVADEPQVRTAPPGARVYVKPYSSPDAEWRLLGPTPLAGVTLARGAYRWRIEADGFEPVELARNTAPEPPDQVVIDVDLAQVGTVPSGMVSVPPIQGFVQLTGFTAEDFVSLEPYFIDRYEVTNQGFKEFVDAGAYTRREYWKHDVVQDGRPRTWTQAMELFRDSSGRPGPATWELGTYAAGQADYPVAGVSWYEAAAYAEFRGASLPTVYHWAHAALTFTRFAPIRGLIVEAGNLSGKGAVAVGSTGSLGPLGTYDMAGNVREWCWNLSGKNRWIVGGDWTDSAYMSIVPYNLPPLDRSATNGFRLVRYSGKEGLAALAMPREVVGRDYRTEKPVSNEVFEVFKRQFAYSPSPAEARVEATDTSAEDWIREKVSIETGYGERMTAYIFTPKTGAGRRQVAVHFMGLPVGVNSSQDLMPGFFDFVVKSGRVLVLPVWKGFYERNDGFMTLTGDRHLQAMRQRMREWRQELGQLLDYLTARPDVHPAALAFLGTSFGGSTALPVVAMEPRFKAAVLHIAGLPYREMLPEVDAVNFAPRITIPVLMLGGRYDSVFPVELSQEPLLTLLGAPAHQKHQVLFDAGHGRLPRGRMIHETLTWLDRYLGEPDNP